MWDYCSCSKDCDINPEGTSVDPRDSVQIPYLEIFIATERNVILTWNLNWIKLTKKSYIKKFENDIKAEKLNPPDSTGFATLWGLDSSLWKVKFHIQSPLSHRHRKNSKIVNRTQRGLFWSYIIFSLKKYFGRKKIDTIQNAGTWTLKRVFSKTIFIYQLSYQVSSL